MVVPLAHTNGGPLAGASQHLLKCGPSDWKVARCSGCRVLSTPSTRIHPYIPIPIAAGGTFSPPTKVISLRLEFTETVPVPKFLYYSEHRELNTLPTNNTNYQTNKKYKKTIVRLILKQENLVVEHLLRTSGTCGGDFLWLNWYWKMKKKKQIEFQYQAMQISTGCCLQPL